MLEHGIPLRPNAVTGGKDGVRYGLEALHPQYRRVQWKDVDGRPTIREALLPDADTELDIADGLVLRHPTRRWCCTQTLHEAAWRRRPDA